MLHSHAQDNCGTSLVEVFTVQQIEAHLHRMSLADTANDSPQGRGQVGLHGYNANGLILPDFGDPNACCVCGLIRLTFEPPAMYCTTCSQRIKRNHVRHPWLVYCCHRIAALSCGCLGPAFLGWLCHHKAPSRHCVLVLSPTWCH